LKNSIFAGFVTGLCALIYLNSGTKEKAPDAPSGSLEMPLSVQESAAVGQSPVAGDQDPAATFAPVTDSSGTVSEGLNLEIQKVRKALPSLAELRNLPSDEVHGTPAKIIEAGAALGELEEYLERRPEEFPEASRFFSDCAVGSEFPSSIRAMCLHSLRNNPSQWAPGVSAKLEALPSEVTDLEAQL